MLAHLRHIGSSMATSDKQASHDQLNVWERTALSAKQIETLNLVGSFAATFGFIGGGVIGGMEGMERFKAENMDTKYVQIHRSCLLKSHKEDVNLVTLRLIDSISHALCFGDFPDLCRQGSRLHSMHIEDVTTPRSSLGAGKALSWVRSWASLRP